MAGEILFPGLEFVNKHALTQKEIEVLIPLLQRPYTAAELSTEFNVPVKSIHHIIQRLRLKRIVILKDKKKSGTNLYDLDESVLT